jgi:carboxyl-terminal processing protease
VSRTHTRCWMLVLALVGACLVIPSARAVDPNKLRDMQREAEAFEKQGDWEKACDLYENILRLKRDIPGIKERYVHCVRRLWQSRRHHDDSYRKEVLSIEYGQAIHLYGVVRDLILDHSLDRKKLNPARLFRMGLEELSYALASEDFRREHIPPDHQIKAAEFRTILLKTWGDFNPASRKEAVKQICEIALAAETYLRVNPTVIVMEFTCGACYSLDEYTVYLTPTQLRELCTSLRGSLVGVGLTLAVQDNKVLVAQVELGSPAARAALSLNDQILSVDRKAVDSLSLDMVATLLEGPPGTMVELEVLSPMMGMRMITLRRETVQMPSVVQSQVENSIGYIKLVSFHENTVTEIDDAIARLTSSGMKALVLDLRGNGGGLFEASVEVARRFLPRGALIATKQHLDERSNIVTTRCESNNPAALTIPLVVLIDNDTASSAEVLAGALKENDRATLIGEPTYGKGCTQFLLKLPDFKGGLPAGGMRLTVAKVFSPRGLPYTGRGVLPDIAIGGNAMQSQSVHLNALGAAQLEAQRLLAMR